MYVVLLGSSSITPGCCGVSICPNLTCGVFAIGVACTGLCTAKCVLNFLFYFGAILTLFLARLSLGASYHSGGCDLSSAGWVDGVLTFNFDRVITLELGGRMPGVSARVVLWCTRGSVLMIGGVVGCVDVL